LVAWCFYILQPFIIPAIWGIIIAVAINPFYEWLKVKLGNRPKTSAVIITLLLLSILIVPSVMFTGSIVDGVQYLYIKVQEGNIDIAPPPQDVLNWPLIGKPLYDLWAQASENLESFLTEIAPQLKSVGGWILSSAAGAGFALFQFLFAIIIAGVLLVNAKKGGKAAYDLSVRLAGNKGEEFAQVVEVTFRNVARGILGVAVIQSLLAALGFAIAGVPLAGLWTLVALILGIIQIGIVPVVVPLIIYMFYTTDTLTATLFMIWCIIIIPVDNLLKPILLGRGAPVPMLVIFLGAIGGFITSGIIGLFVGAVVLSIGYKLFLTWLHEEEETATKTD